jgi:DNA-binding NarL/FixJ family response regulator
MVVRDGVRLMAEQTSDLEFSGGAADSNELFDLLERVRPDVLLLDLRLGDADGVAVCAAARASHPDLKIILFTAFGEVDTLRSAIDAGAHGFVLKDVSTRGLPKIIRHVSEHGSYYDARVAGKLLRGTATTSAPLGPSLNDRELAILRHLASGKVNREIAVELNLSPHTIKFYISRMMRKLGVTRRAELVKVGFQRQLL